MATGKKNERGKTELVKPQGRVREDITISVKQCRHVPNEKRETCELPERETRCGQKQSWISLLTNGGMRTNPAKRSRRRRTIFGKKKKKRKRQGCLNSKIGASTRKGQVDERKNRLWSLIAKTGRKKGKIKRKT